MSTTKRTPAPEFVLVYDSKRPTSLHATVGEKQCWKGHMRQASPEELERLKNARCKHCVARLEKVA